MQACYSCLKISDIGHLVSHAKNRVRHIRKANLHRFHFVTDGMRKKVLLCTKCARALRGTMQKQRDDHAKSRAASVKPETKSKTKSKI